MSVENNLFQMMASEILAKSTRKSSKKSLGSLLYDDFCSNLFSKIKTITPVQKKFVIGFYIDKKDIFSLEILSTAIKITVNKKIGTLKDRRNLFRDVSQLGHWGNGDYQIKLENGEDFDYVIEVITQIS
ncbi:hypothetical protein FD961_02665 [Polynucleobacter sp. TSB-Sco08W16]|uniref:hypothetical protein n=1 Tax=Polynucleobacter sp. TSB-Sco08W16 TaxID=1758374 RepID=UPI001BFEA472|nr:hypothetical protein [Polynucleobacter sp. TSB-Sco08W16]QWD74741.1 hypothetical protein FD961_02665 [Polynucleobacter sp. TSB-Sco08W16]